MSEVPSYAPQFHRGTYTRTSGKAIASLALGIVMCVPLITSLPAILFAIAGFRATRDPGVRGRGMAIAGLVLGICGTLLWSALAAFVVFLLVASQKPRAVLSEFAADLGRDDLPAATALCEPATVVPGSMEKLHDYIAPFGAYTDERCSNINLQPGTCVLSGTMHFAAGDHVYTATLKKNGSDWKIWGVHIY